MYSFRNRITKNKCHNISKKFRKEDYFHLFLNKWFKLLQISSLVLENVPSGLFTKYYVKRSIHNVVLTFWTHCYTEKFQTEKNEIKEINSESIF